MNFKEIAKDLIYDQEQVLKEYGYGINSRAESFIKDSVLLHTRYRYAVTREYIHILNASHVINKDTYVKLLKNLFEEENILVKEIDSHSLTTHP